jgi:UDP-N-acetylmuramoyl-tripeptide--D-alanyl-D-alanine ligase
LDATVLHGEDEEMFGGVCVDSRKIRKGDLFFALPGTRCDGHEFAVEAFTKGASAVVVERRIPILKTQILVPSAVEALGRLAQAYRMALKARVIAVTGSNGKTTTKEMLAHILTGTDSRVVRAPASFNNHIGLPLTILQADAATDFLVLEVGANHPGEIAALAEIARPDAACVTTIGPSHLEGFGTVQAIAREKFSLIRSVKSGGFGVINVDSPELEPLVKEFSGRLVTVGVRNPADYGAEEVEDRGGSLQFRVRGVPFVLNLYGAWNITNALAASASAHAYGVPLELCAQRLGTFRPPKMRMERLTIDGVTVINDAYNANPLSAENALREFSRLPSSGRRIAVVGDMAELGEHSKGCHQALGRAIAELGGIDQVIAVGEEVAHLVQSIGPTPKWRYFDDVHEAADYLMQVARPGDLVLLKGSRVIGLERILEDWVRRETKPVG